MVYGYYIIDTAGNQRFFTEGCNYCNMSTGGQHKSNCPCKDLKIADKQTRLTEIRERSYIRYGEAWCQLAIR